MGSGWCVGGQLSQEPVVGTCQHRLPWSLSDPEGCSPEWQGGQAWRSPSALCYVLLNDPFLLLSPPSERPDFTTKRNQISVINYLAREKRTKECIRKPDFSS